MGTTNDKGVVHVVTSRDSKSLERSIIEVTRSIKLLKVFNPNLLIALIGSPEVLRNTSLPKTDFLIPSQWPEFNGYMGSKIQSILLSPFKYTLVLDNDTLPISDISSGFDFLNNRDIALSLDSEEEVRNDTRGLTNFQNGVMFVKKSDDIITLFERWTTTVIGKGPPTPTRYVFSKLLHDSNINIYTLSRNWNLRIDDPEYRYGYIEPLLQRSLSSARILHSHLLRPYAIEIFKRHPRFEHIKQIL